MVKYEAFPKSLDWRGGYIGIRYHYSSNGRVSEIDITDHLPLKLRKNAKAFVRGARDLRGIISGDTIVKVLRYE